MEPVLQNLNGNQKTNNSVEGWPSSFSSRNVLCFTHTASKFFLQTTREQNLTEKGLIRLKFGGKLYKCAEYEQLQQKISETLTNYQYNDLILQLEALSYNFDL